MDELLHDMWRQLAARPSGPMAFRFYLQPVMAILLATRDGWKDAKAGRPPYLFGLATDRDQRRARMLDGWRSISRVFLLAIAMDVIYELIVLHAIHPLESLIIAITLAIIPYALLRGPACRIAAHYLHRPHHAR